MKVITFYCNPADTTYYSDHSKKWIENVESFGLDYHIEELKNTGDYWSNTRRKPQYILNCLNRFKKPVLWVDVDTTFKFYEPYQSKPIIAVDRPHEGRDRIHSCALHFDYCQESIQFLNTWIKLCRENKTKTNKPKGDHHFLYKAKRLTKIKIHRFKKDFWDVENQSYSPFGNSV